MRAFADSWGLLYMTLFFVASSCGSCARRKKHSDDAARIPFKED
jgi:cbb3-type cytochrome oxidase subunit 3